MDKEFLDKLSAVQMELKAPKGQYNSFGKYSYRSCEDILEAVKPLLSKNGLTLLLTDEPVAVGNRVYIKATARSIGGGDSIEVTAYAREPEDKKGMDTSQVTGTASSYGSARTHRSCTGQRQKFSGLGQASGKGRGVCGTSVLHDGLKNSVYDCEKSGV